jgi:hypothetical protein
MIEKTARRCNCLLSFSYYELEVAVNPFNGNGTVQRGI